MSFDLETFEKYSLIASFDNQVKLCNEISNDPQFKMESFILDSNQNMAWYSKVLEKLKEDTTSEKQESKPDLTVLQQKIDNKNQTTNEPAPSQAIKTEPFQQQRTVQTKRNITKSNYCHMNSHWSRDFNLLEVIQQWYPFKFKLSFPKASSLDSNQQKEFMELHARYNKSPELVSFDSKNYKRYTYFKNLLNTERNEFEKYLRDYFESASNDDYNFMEQEAHPYIEEMIRLIQNRALEYDRFYKQIEKIILFTDNTKTFLKFEKTLLNMGKIPSINIPNISLTMQPSLEIRQSVINKRAPVTHSSEDRANQIPSKKYNKIKISKDENAKKLAEKYQANFVMTLSTFENLMSQYQNEDELLMPFSVHEFKTTDGNVHKSIFIEKPLISTNLSKREKNEKFYKKSLMCTLTKEPTFQNKRFIGNRMKLNESKYTDNVADEGEGEEEQSEDKKRSNLEKFETETMNYDLMSNIETFGVGDTGLEQKRRKSYVEGVHFDKNSKNSEQERDKEEAKTVIEPINEDNSEEEDDNLIIDVPEIIEKIKEAEEEDGEIMGPASPEPMDHSEKPDLQKDSKTSTEEAKMFNPKVIPLEQTTLLIKAIDKPVSASNVQNTFIPTKNQPSENAVDYKQIENIHFNTNYSLWTFDHNIKVLIRWSHDGVLLNENGFRENLVLIPKLEYQPQFGCEKISRRAYCKMWTKSYIKNSSDVLLCRINVYTNHLISISKLSFNKLNEMLSQESFGFNPNVAMSHVFTLFNKLLSLQPANYLLSKSSKEINSYLIMKAIETKHNAFDLHFRCTVFDNLVERKPQWLPIDHEIYLPYHYQFNRIPCTFEPAKVSPKKKKNKRKRKKAE